MKVRQARGVGDSQLKNTEPQAQTNPQQCRPRLRARVRLPSLPGAYAPGFRLSPASRAPDENENTNQCRTYFLAKHLRSGPKATLKNLPYVLTLTLCFNGRSSKEE